MNPPVCEDTEESLAKVLGPQSKLKNNLLHMTFKAQHLSGAVQMPLARIPLVVKILTLSKISLGLSLGSHLLTEA